MFNQKLRLWDTETKRMIYPKTPVEIEDNKDAYKLGYEDYAVSLNGNILKKVEIDWSHKYSMLSHEYANSLIVMRSIGLLDNQGKEIYEGDIFQKINYDGKELNFIIEWNGKIACFMCYEQHTKMNYGYSFKEINLDVVNIIGNKYENIELLRK